MSLTWNLLTAALPKEVIDPVKEKLAKANLPPMASPGNVKDYDAADLHVRTKGSKFHCTSGGNYVDVFQGVVVRCAKDTAMAVMPTPRHGTTLSYPGVKCQGTAINFSTHIKTAFEKALSAGGLVVDGGSDSE
ncbi:hypothetical protein EDC04DRAFT_2601080 [Pisolithus marmoratus]|nr:hypothetical protein EDC04DRAFT_2601080 [Pisolithus marmoratus]